jgi:hypothetical protein
MTSYGYNRSTIGWIEERREELFRQLQFAVGNIGCAGYYDGLQEKQILYVENMKLNSSSGIYIKNIGHLSEEGRNGIFESADETYLEVMIPKLNGRTYLGVLMPEASKGERLLSEQRFREKELEAGK